MKRLLTTFIVAFAALGIQAQGWKANYPGVMLQSFYWIEDLPKDATEEQKQAYEQEFKQLGWKSLTAQADELSEFFSLIWTPQSGRTDGNPSMGYDPTHWFNHNATFGTTSEIRAMTAAYKERGTGIITDVILNHRVTGSADWCKFPRETYNGQSLTYAINGESYTLTPEDICADDDGGTTATWASEHGYTLSSNNDTGEDFSGFRDLDHKSENVQRCVKAYLDYLLNNLGYSGFRLDMVKGYSPYYTGLYNAAVKPEFSVGEYWSDNGQIIGWMNGTRVNDEVQSGAFDFQFKYKLNEACSGNWGALVPDENACLAWNSYWPRYGVTFVDNHDTYRDHNRCGGNLLAANAYMISMPGTPCVFMKHWLQYKRQIKQFIYARKFAGITNQSPYSLTCDNGQCVATRVANKLEVVMGNGTGYNPGEGWKLAESGSNYAVYLSTSLETPWVSLPTGSYEGPVTVRFTALSNSSQTMVYTTDGTEPTAESTQIESGGKLKFNADCVLKVGLLVGGNVVNVQTRKYQVTPGTENVITINVYAKQAPYLYVWDAEDEVLNGEWPGTLMDETTKTTNGTQWYTKTFTVVGNINIIFNDGKGNQTGNIAGLGDGQHYFAYNGSSTYTPVDATYEPGTTPEPEEPLYILGEANGNTWAPNVGVEMAPLGNNKYTAEVNFDGRNSGYNYFSFTRKLADTADDWASIAPLRIGAEASSDYDVELNVAMPIRKGETAFKIPAGDYTLNADLGEMMLTVLEGHQGISTIATDDAAAKTRYNLAGQVVKANYRGLVLTQGKKMMVK